jgi:hypothetical protein
MTVKIAIINDSTVLTDAQVAAAVPPLQKQIDRDAGPAWGISAQLRFVPSASLRPTSGGSRSSTIRMRPARLAITT